jgi:prepilin-type processing-associated H-X9-DG protein
MPRRFPPTSRSLRERRGYTLFDVLIVVVAAGLIGAALLPALLRSHAESRRQTCVDNLRRLSQAARMYADDHDGYPVPASIKYPKTVPGVTWYGTVAYWPMLLRSYVRDTGAYYCPAAPFAQVPFGPGLEWKTYAVNAHVSPRLPIQRPGARLGPLSRIERPEETGYFVDSTGVCILHTEEFILDPAADFESLRISLRTWKPNRATYPAHDGGVNIVFVDGHMDWIAARDYVGNEEIGRRIWGSLP